MGGGESMNESRVTKLCMESSEKPDSAESPASVLQRDIAMPSAELLTKLCMESTTQLITATPTARQLTKPSVECAETSAWLTKLCAESTE